jgi:hypothetical protein
MEIVLLWLDELDDLIFAGFSLWLRLRKLCLGVALAAALGLHALPTLGIAADGGAALLDVSLLALAAWMLIAALSARIEQSLSSIVGDA